MNISSFPKMKISIILPHMKKYGGVRRFIEFTKRLNNLGHKTTIYCADLSFKEFYQQIGLNDDHVRPIDEVNTANDDVCLCGDTSSLDLLDKSNAKLKVVMVIFPPYRTEKIIGTTYMLGSYGDWLIRDDVIVVGNSTGWEKHPGTQESIPLRDNYYTIAGAVNTEMFKPNLNVKREDNDFRVLFMGRERPWKGLETILMAQERCKSKFPDIKWAYFSTEKNNNIPSDIKPFINLTQEEMCGLYNSSDCFVSHELLAGWQNTSAEAMACGLPIITTPIGASDFAEQDRTAFITDFKKPNDIVRYLATLKNNEGLCKILGKSSRSRIKEFSWENYTYKWIELLNKVLVNKGFSEFNHKKEKEFEKFDAWQPKKKEIETLLNNNNKQIEQNKSKSIKEQVVNGITINSDQMEVKNKPITSINKKELTNKEKIKELKKEINKDSSNKNLNVLDKIDKKINRNIEEKTNVEIKKEFSLSVKKTNKELAELKAKNILDFFKLQGIDLSKKNKPFDKYEKLGAYHWSSNDKYYHKYTSNLISLIKNVKDNFIDFDHVLDVGGGDGWVSNELLKLDLDVTLVDPNETAIKLAKQKIGSRGNFEAICGDFFNINDFNGCILISQVIEHLYEPEKILDKAISLNPKSLVVTTPLAKIDGTHWDPQYHVYEYNTKELLELFDNYRNDYLIKYFNENINQYVILLNKKELLTNYLLDLEIQLGVDPNTMKNHSLKLENKDVIEIVPKILDITSSYEQTKLQDL